MAVPVQTVQEGQRFGPAVVTVPEIRRNRKRYAQMLCDCGNSYETLISQLIKGSTEVCWCTQRKAVKEARSRPEDQARIRAQAASSGASTAAANKRNKTTHGLTRTHPLYSTWSGMMTRCYNEKQLAYANYGGRGISVCNRWHDVRNFVEDIELLLGPKAGKGHEMTLDRIDNNGNYEPDNVRWATWSEQVRNRR